MPQGIEAKFSCRIISLVFVFLFLKKCCPQCYQRHSSFWVHKTMLPVPGLRAVLIRRTCVSLSLTTALEKVSASPVMGLHFLFFGERQHLLNVLALHFLQHEISQKIYALTLLGHFHGLINCRLEIRTTIPEISSEHPASWRGKRVPWGLSRQTRKISKQWAGGWDHSALTCLNASICFWLRVTSNSWKTFLWPIPLPKNLMFFFVTSSQKGLRRSSV